MVITMHVNSHYIKCNLPNQYVEDKYREESECERIHIYQLFKRLKRIENCLLVDQKTREEQDAGPQHRVGLGGESILINRQCVV